MELELEHGAYWLLELEPEMLLVLSGGGMIIGEGEKLETVITGVQDKPEAWVAVVVITAAVSGNDRPSSMHVRGSFCGLQRLSQQQRHLKSDLTLNKNFLCGRRLILASFSLLARRTSAQICLQYQEPINNDHNNSFVE
jgi:hypothetical protein